MTGLVFVINRNAAPTRRETIANVEYLIVPTVALVPGVLNGELVNESEIVPEDWNGMPVTISHPQENGQFVSARQPHIETLNPARVYNSHREDGNLKADIYINIAQAQAIGGDWTEAIKRFESGQVVPVSTGYFRNQEMTAGVLNGKAYASIARNIRPDQLAILLNEDGACSIADGCGAPRVNQLAVNQDDYSDSVIIAFYPSTADAQALAMEATGLPAGSEPLAAADLHVTLCYLGKIDEITEGQDKAMKALIDFASHMPIVRATVGGVGQFNNADPGALFAIIDSPYLQDWRRSLVYWIEDYFSMAGASAYGFNPHMTLAYVPAGQPVALPMLERRELIFDRIALSWGTQTTLFALQGEPMEAMTGNAKKSKMGFLGRIAAKLGINFKTNELEENTVNEKDKLIAALATNARCKFDKEALTKFDESQLKTLSESLAEPVAETPPPAAVATPPAGAVAETSPAPATPDPMAVVTAELKRLGEKVDGLTGQVATNANTEKAQIIAALTANANSIFTETEYQALELPMLRKLAQQYAPADYGVRGMPMMVNSEGSGGWRLYQDKPAEGGK